LRAIAQKLVLSPDIKLEEVAKATKGFSGADLQALLYNAHLEVVHTAISAAVPVRDQKNGNEGRPLQYAIFGGANGEPHVKSRAEEAALQKRVHPELGLRVLWLSCSIATTNTIQLTTGVRRSEECSCRRSICVREGIQSFQEISVMYSNPNTDLYLQRVIMPEHLLRALKTTRPSVSSGERERLTQM
jgi:SpoVK/Ycf46/Vps4 family AAA+-type ATPase